MAERTGYVFDTAFPDETERLALGEELWDPGTIERLTATGVGAGWRCLEAGAGRGSIARWLAERVGPDGRVVAVDLRTDRLGWLAGHGVTVRECDVASGELPEGAFDLVHARLVLQHVTDRPAAVGRLARALRPGGFLVLEDTDTAPLFSHPTRPDFLGDVRRAAYEVMCASGYHPRCGLLDEELARAVGLAGVRSEGRCVVVRGGSGAARWYALWISHLRPGILARTDLIGRQIDAALAELADPGNVWLSQVMVTVTGRRPLPGERAAQGGDR